MSALRFLSRLAAAVCQLLPQRVHGIATCSPLRGLPSSIVSCFPLSATSASGLRSRGFAVSANSSPEGACRLSQINCETAHIGAGLPYGVSLERTLHTGLGSMQSGAAAPLPVAEVKVWKASSGEQKMKHLRSLPVDQRWRFLKRLEASGQRPHIKMWTAALHDIASSTSLEALVALVEELWEKGYSPDAVTYVPLLEACRREFRVSEALDIYIYKHMISGRSVQPDSGTFRVLATVLKECYAGSQSTDFVTPRSKGMLHVHAILEGMHNFGVPMDLPIGSTLLTVLSKVDSFADPAKTIKLAKEIQVAIRNQGLVPNDTVCAAVVNCHTAAKRGDMRSALAAYEEMESLGEEVGYRTYATLIKAYSHGGEFVQALHLLHQAVSEGIGFEGRTLGLIYQVISAAGRHKEAERFFKEVEGGNQLNSFIVAAHMRNCFSQKKLNDVYLLSEKYHSLFTVDISRGEPHRLHLGEVLLESLAEHPTKKGIDMICKSLGFCESRLAGTCTQLLCNPSNESWDAFFNVVIEYQGKAPVRALELIQLLSNCFWALGRREDSVHMLARVRKDTRLLQAVMKERDTYIRLDLHSMMVNVGLGMVLLALRELVAKSTKHHWAALVSKGLVVITGKGHRQQLSGGLRLAVQKLSLEYGFPSIRLIPLQGGGGYLIDGTTIAHWLVTLTYRNRLSRG